jgi:membrane protease YdiL (CAAX protease family)
VLAVVLQLVTSLGFFALMGLTGNSFQLTDVGDDVFDQGAEVLEWGDRRLKAAAEGKTLPDAPEVYANITSIKLGFGTTIVHQVLLVVVAAVIIQRTTVKGFWRAFKLEGFSFDELWLPAVAVLVMYPVVIFFAYLASLIGIDARSAVPAAVVRDNGALALAGILACLLAPIAEETIFRGVIFGGLMKWGFWPAAILTSLLFSAAHIDLASFIPFFLIGLTLCWLYWRRGVLWDSIAFHCLFNTASYVILILSR